MMGADRLSQQIEYAKMNFDRNLPCLLFLANAFYINPNMTSQYKRIATFAFRSDV